MERTYKVILYDDIIYPVFLDDCQSHSVLFRICQNGDF